MFNTGQKKKMQYSYKTDNHIFKLSSKETYHCPFYPKSLILINYHSFDWGYTAWRFSYKHSTESSKNEENICNFKTKMRNSFCYLNVSSLGVIFSSHRFHTYSVTMCFLIKWHYVFKIKIYIIILFPFWKIIFFNHIKTVQHFSNYCTK